MTEPRSHTTEVLVEGLRFPEGPRWHGHLLFVSDMHDGRVLMEGRPEEVVAHEDVRRVYLGERFSL